MQAGIVHGLAGQAILLTVQQAADEAKQKIDSCDEQLCQDGRNALYIDTSIVVSAVGQATIAIPTIVQCMREALHCA